MLLHYFSAVASYGWIEYFELPTKNTVLGRITVAPDKDESVWFTKLQSDRLDTINFNKKELGFYHDRRKRKMTSRKVVRRGQEPKLVT